MITDTRTLWTILQKTNLEVYEHKTWNTKENKPNSGRNSKIMYQDE